MAFTHNTNLMHDSANLTTQDKAILLKNRIAELKQKQTNLYVGQPLAVQSDDECYQEIAKACDSFVNEPSEENERQLALTLEKHNLELYCYEAEITSKDKRDVARMAFNGYVDRPQEYQLSPIIRDMKNKPLERQKVGAEEYDLSFSSTWNVFKQIPEFAVLEDKVKKGLSALGIPPQTLPSLQVKDFCYIINEQMRDANYGGAVRVFKESRKARNTKRFITENETEFRDGLLAMPGIKKDYVEMLIKAMKKGVTDLTKYKENGQPVWKEAWNDQPIVDVHHILNIKDAAVNMDENNVDKINDYENMCFIVRYPQHDAMHALEQDLQGNYHDDIFFNREIGKKMFYRIQPPEGVRCMLGFHNMIYDRGYLGLPEKQKVEMKEKAEQNPNRISGKYGRQNYANKAKDPYRQRREWNNRGRYGAW